MKAEIMKKLLLISKEIFNFISSRNTFQHDIEEKSVTLRNTE